MREHECPAVALHRAWDNALPPALSIDPGDQVTFSTVDAQDGAIPPPPWAESRPPSRDWGVQPTIRRGHPLSGPVVVRGAEPGDLLAVRVLAVTPHDWGWTATGENGILGREPESQTLLHWDLRGAVAIPWSTDRPQLRFRVPMRPFCGVMGVATAEPGELPTRPPRAVGGGNMDARRLVAGSTLFLPVAVPGALFSVGDVHAAQGDGEVCGTGIECGATVSLQFDLVPGRDLGAPAYETPAAPPPGPCYATTGIGPDLMEAGRQAIRQMIAHLQREYGLDLGAAYVLCSVAVDLTITEVVNGPNWVVSALLPLEIFSRD